MQAAEQAGDMAQPLQLLPSKRHQIQRTLTKAQITFLPLNTYPSFH